MKYLVINIDKMWDFFIYKTFKKIETLPFKKENIFIKSKRY